MADAVEAFMVPVRGFRNSREKPEYILVQLMAHNVVSWLAQAGEWPYAVAMPVDGMSG